MSLATVELNMTRANVPDVNIPVPTMDYVLTKADLPLSLLRLHPNRGFPIPLLEPTEYRSKGTKSSTVKDVLEQACFGALAQKDCFGVGAMAVPRKG